MDLIRGFHNLSGNECGCVATIGNFDGVHLGHQAVLAQLTQYGKMLDLPVVVVIFEPQPQEFFNDENTAPARLTRFREKVQALQRYGVDKVVAVPFNRVIASMPADDFIRRLLVDGLKVRHLVVGDDFRFGYHRRGDFALLKAAGERHGFQVANMHSFEVDGVRASSTLIRKALDEGDIVTAEKLLGRTFRLSGRVAYGDQRGRQLGFPTANINLRRLASPVRGVFAVEVYGLESSPLQGVANVGTRPTFNGKTTVLEVHLLDFNDDIYGCHLNVNFRYRVRSERRFEGLDALKAQIDRDIETTKNFFQSHVAATQSTHAVRNR